VVNVGLLGELQAEAQLVMQGWHPIRLDTAQMAANADLVVVNRLKRVMIQVKTTDAKPTNSHRDFLGFGYATAYLSNATPIFNGKDSPLLADVIIGVHYRQEKSRFVVLPVAVAERLCRLACDYWFNVPTRTASGKRSTSFPIYLAFDRLPGTHSEHHGRLKRNLCTFENAWQILDEPIEKLHDISAWPIQT
jgi:hypothetical protein